jgi:ectoine hydroxylase-related dioxygenase (phytanoyl-CoA dioxygenase family)
MSCRFTRQPLLDEGFVVIPGPVVPSGVPELAAAFDAAVRDADPGDIHVGSTTTRIVDFVNRGPAFDGLYLYPPLLEACDLVIGGPFRLSTMHARTVRPGVRAQNLHVDFARDADGWPMIGFILMIDDFGPDNGATRFVPGSHRWAEPDDSVDRAAPYDGEVLACGPAGSLIVLNGSVWHGHAANTSQTPRRSIQGAFIRREVPSGANLAARMRPETLARLSSQAKYLLAL